MKKPTPKYPIDATVQRRLDALEWLIDGEYERSAKVFQDRTGITMTQVNQWFSGYRALRDKALRRLEEKTRKEAGWFDVVHGRVAATMPMIRAGDAETSPARDVLTALAATIKAIPDLLQPAARDALVKWATNQATFEQLLATIDALARPVSLQDDASESRPVPDAKGYVKRNTTPPRSIANIVRDERGPKKPRQK